MGPLQLIKSAIVKDTVFRTVASLFTDDPHIRRMFTVDDKFDSTH